MTYEASTHLIKTFLNINRAGILVNAELILLLLAFDIMFSLPPGHTKVVRKTLEIT